MMMERPKLALVAGLLSVSLLLTEEVVFGQIGLGPSRPAASPAPSPAQELPSDLEPLPPPPPKTNFEITGRYTAQRKPRIAVVPFDNTNAEAQTARFGASVQAMLVTFLKRKSQFVVVERQKLGEVLNEWRRNQQGMTNVQAMDPNDRELLEKLDAFVQGSVTLLEPTTTTTVASGNNGSNVKSGPRIEIDALLVSRIDGRIIAAAQRSGPVTCLRAIVERLGVALEQEFLRPYYGKLKINLADPENVRVFLTPILMDTALDEERPPVERSSTVKIGGEYDNVEPWTTDPTTYTIENLLSGWYSMRLERPGYEGLGAEYTSWEARDVSGETRIFEKASDLSLDRIPVARRRFLVRVDPLATEVIDGDSLDLHFRKKGGSLAPRIKRQYLDEDYTGSAKRVFLFGNKGLEINNLKVLDEYGEDGSCDLFREILPQKADYGVTYIAAGQEFDFSTFKGGQLVIEHYQGAVVPVGEFIMSQWEPYYRLHSSPVMVRDRDQDKATRTAMTRETLPLWLVVTGPRKPYKVFLSGKETSYRSDLLLDFEKPKEQSGLPVDAYTLTTNIPGLEGWSRTVELMPRGVDPPIYDPDLPTEEPEVAEPETDDEGKGTQENGKKKEPVKRREISPIREAAKPADGEHRVTGAQVKTRLSIGGRLGVLGSFPGRNFEDVFVDREISLILDALLPPQEEDEVERCNPNWRDSLVQVGKVLGGVALGVLVEVNRQAQIQSGRIPAASPPAQVVPVPAPAPVNAAPIDSATAAGSAATTPPAPPPPPVREPYLEIDREKLLALLAQRLADLDLLVLDNLDTSRLRRSPDALAVVGDYLARGGALFGFLSEGGSYDVLAGAPLNLDVNGKPSNQFELSTGDVDGLEFSFKKKKVKVKSKRIVPKLEKLPGKGWRVLAFSQGAKNPRILEKGSRDRGGYMAFWVDRPVVFRGCEGEQVADIEAARAKIELHVLNWTRELLDRRYSRKDVEPPRAAEKTKP